MRKTLALALGLLLAFSGAAFAQLATGNIYGTVKDESGAVLPGVSVEMTGPFGTQTAVSSASGTFRFVNLASGEYTLALTMSGFSKTTRRTRVVTGENVEFTLTLKVSGVAETVDVTGEVPLVDTKRRGTATTMTTEELGSVPNARDPWAVLKAVPGVLVDRVNIAGNENGQQASSSSKGSSSSDQTWNLDGIVVTDMSATGASPTYFDFGAFQEINVTTGGTDLSMQTGGSGVNLVTKRGTNSFHGSARMIIAHDKMSFGNISDQNQSPYSPNSLASDPRLKNKDGSFRNQGDHIQQITDYGFDLGGPIIKDKLWFYGTYGKQDIRLTRLNNTPDKTLLPSYNFKINWQASSNTMINAYYFLGSKQKFGRSPGTGLSEEDGILWNQDNAFTDGGLPGGLWKLQVDHTFGKNFFVSAKGAYYDTGFGLAARGDATKNATFDYVNSVAKGTFSTYLAVRPQKLLNLDGNYFFEGLGGNNELKFGFGYRDLMTTSSTTWPGNGLAGAINDTGNNPDSKVAFAYRDYFVRYGGKYITGYIGDMLSKNRFTLNVGVRWDKQTAKNLESEALANASLPTRMPAAVYPGGDNLQDWSTFSPRVGMSYALDEGRKTVARLSYSRYYQQLSFGDVSRENPTNYSYMAFTWNDANGDGFVQAGEVNQGSLLYWGGIDPNNPSQVTAGTNKIDRDRKPKHDDEFILGIDHELAPSFSVGAAFTYRMADDWGGTRRLAGTCSGEPTMATCPTIGPSGYTQNAPSTANGYTAFTYSPNSALVSAGKGGNIATNREGYSTKYKGLELTMNKRLSNKWMARVAFSYQDWTQHFDGTPIGGNGNPTRLQNDSLVEGDVVQLLAGGSGKGNLFYSSFKWQFYGNALYQLPWGFDLSGSAWGRQGGLKPVMLRLGAGSDGTVSALANPTAESERYGNVWDFDLRLAKTLKFGKQAGLTLAAEWFNVMNSGQVLIRIRQANTSAYNRVDEVLSPSIFRLGATFSF